MTTTVPSTQGYQPIHAKHSYLEVEEAFIGPTTAHEGLTTATIAPKAGDDIYNLSNNDSGKIITIGVIDAALVVNLPDPSPGVTFTFVVIVDPAVDITITAQGTQIFGNVLCGGASNQAAAAGSTTVLIDNSATPLPGDYLKFEGISTTQWLVSGVSDAVVVYVFA